MSILNPTPGELFDRLCILELKLKDAIDRSIPCDHFEEERDQIQKFLAALPPATTTIDLTGTTIRLAQVNSTLWQLTEEQMSAQNETYAEVQYSAHLLIELRSSNRERHRLRGLIDEAYNSYRGAEKL